MKTLKIEIPEGFEIDKMDTKTGTVSFKPIKAKYPLDISKLSRPGYYIDNMSYIAEAKNDGRYTAAGIDLNLCDTREEAEAFLALMQLRRLANAWNKIDGYVPDFTTASVKYIILNSTNEISINTSCGVSSPLAFKNNTLTQLFLETFKDLLETAKPLL